MTSLATLLVTLYFVRGENLYDFVFERVKLPKALHFPEPSSSLACTLYSVSSPVVLPHPQNLHHPDEDVEEIQLQADTLVYHILLDHASFGKPGMVENLLHIVEGEATEDRESTIQPDVLCPHQSPGSGRREDEGCESGEGDNDHTGEEGTAKVEVLLLLGRSTNEGDRTHHAHGVKTSSRKKGRRHEQEWREDGGLRNVETGPQRVFLNVAA